MEGGLRKRPNVVPTTAAQSPSPSSATGTTETQQPQNGTAAMGANDPPRQSRGGGATRCVWLVLRLLGCVYYSMGFIWRISLHTGSECEMTYSYRNFLEIQITSNHFTTSTPPPSKATDSYKLYKFVDGRDPRYQRLLRDQQPLVGNAHCSGIKGHSTNDNNTTVVLYVPGHWGSFDQARSVGAHGTQWTRTTQQQTNMQKDQRAMMDGTWSGKEERIENFIYEVYAVDFSEQGGALHGRFLEMQSDFVAHVVESLAVSKKCWTMAMNLRIQK